MEKVITYLTQQQEITAENREKFKERCLEYEQAHPDENIWAKIGDFIDEAGEDSDKFLMLLEEDYKDLSFCLFTDENAILNDFEDSDSNFEEEEKPVKQEEKVEVKEEEEVEEIVSDTPIPEESKNEHEEAAPDIYDDDDEQIQDRSNRRIASDESEEEKNESSYDPLDANNHNKGDGNKEGGNNPNMISIKESLKFISNPPSMKNVDPRLLSSNPNLMQQTLNNPMFKQFKNINPAILSNLMQSMKPLNQMGMPMPQRPPVENKNVGQFGKAPENQNPRANLGPQGNQQQKRQEGNKRKADPCAIHVKNIPQPLNKISTLADYFGKFGDVVNVSSNVNKGYANIKFEEPFGARDAFACEDPVMGNPRIKVYYNANDTQSPQPQKAKIGSNLTFESEEAKKQREKVEEKRQRKQQRDKEIEEFNSLFRKLLRESNDSSLTEEEKTRKK